MLQNPVNALVGNAMKKASALFQEAYDLDWAQMCSLEVGGHKEGEETASLPGTRWYMEPNPEDFALLSKRHKNVLPFALSSRTGTLTFNVSSHPGNSSIQHSEIHLKELQDLGAKMKQVSVQAVTYPDLLFKHIRRRVDLLVLDIEGHEVEFLKSLLSIPPALLPLAVCIECGYDWTPRLELLTKLGYQADFFFYNNCFLSQLPNSQKKTALMAEYNRQWPEFVWAGNTIYKNHLVAKA